MATTVVARPASALRNRRDAQRPGLARVSTRATTVEAMDFSIPRYPTPPVVSPDYILDKFKNSPASLVVHLHQNHFRFDQQDGNFSYTSPMKIVIEHIRNRTVPHEMLEELYAANVAWYDGHLIVEVHNHKVKGAADGATTTNQVGATDNVAYSIHNYNEHITPSPFGKHPEYKLRGLPPPTDEVKAEKDKMPAPEQPASAMQKKGAPAPMTFRVALGPTSQSLAEEMQILATTPYQEPRTDRHGSLAPGTPSLAHPPTPLTSVPATPKIPNQSRMMLDETNAKEWEAMIINTTAPALVLGPARNLNESLAVIDMTTDPRHCEPPPAPKERKRTVAEMEADEAQAATQERFMLSCDDRHLSMLTSSAAGAAGESSRAGASGEAQFKRFRLIENLKLQRAEQKRAEAEKESQKALLKKQQQDADARKKIELEQHAAQQAAAAHQQAANQQEFMRQQQIRAQRAVQAQQAAANQQAMQATATTSAQQMPAMTSAPTHSMAPAQQTIHMSPVLRQHTPMSGSPTLNGTPMSSAPPTSIPMALSASNQGAGSPPNRPPSAVPQGMVRQVSQQQGSSHGTPHMMSTPSMANAAPVTRHMTPTPRVNQQSSPMPNPAQTPQMMMPMPAQNMTPEQQQALLMRRNAAMNGGQQAMGQMSPQQMAQLMQMRQNQNQMAGNPQQGMQGMQMTPQMLAQAQQMRMNQGSPQQPNPQVQAMAQINQQMQALFQNIPAPVQQRLNAIRLNMQNSHAQEEQMRKQQFLAPYQQQGMQPPPETMNAFQMNMNKQKLDFHVRMRNSLMQQRAQLLQQYQNQMQAQNVGQGVQTPPAQSQQAYMQQLLASQNRMRQQAIMAQQNGQNGMNNQGGGNPGMQQRMAAQGGGGQMMNGGGGGMNPQIMQQMGMGGQNFQNLNPQQQQTFMQQLQMRAMQQQNNNAAQNGQMGMGNGGGGGMM